MFITNYTDPYGRTAQEALAIARADEHFVNGYIKDGIKYGSTDLQTIENAKAIMEADQFMGIVAGSARVPLEGKVPGAGPGDYAICAVVIENNHENTDGTREINPWGNDAAWPDGGNPRVLRQHRV